MKVYRGAPFAGKTIFATPGFQWHTRLLTSIGMHSACGDGRLAREAGNWKHDTLFTGFTVPAHFPTHLVVTGTNSTSISVAPVRLAEIHSSSRQSQLYVLLCAPRCFKLFVAFRAASFVTAVANIGTFSIVFRSLCICSHCHGSETSTILRTNPLDFVLKKHVPLGSGGQYLELNSASPQHLHQSIFRVMTGQIELSKLQNR